MPEFKPTVEFRKKVKRRQRVLLFQKWLATLIFAVIAFLPTILFFVVKGALNPTGFWETLATYAFGILVFGGVQFVLLILFLHVLFTVIWD